MIDDLDRSLHTLLTRQLLEAYLDGCGAGSRAQVLLTTHDVLLMDQDLLRRAAELARALPDQAANDYAKAVHERLEAEYVTSTEIERLVRQRVGQDVFRGAPI